MNWLRATRALRSVFGLFLLAACGGPRGPASAAPRASLGDESTPAPTASAPSASVDVEAHASASPLTPLPVSWDCANPTPPSLEQASMANVVRSPSEGQRVALDGLQKQNVRLELPRLRSAVRPFVALDHLAPREARARMRLTELHSEWDSLRPGSHRLVVFFLDDSGGVVHRVPGEPLLAVRHFEVTASNGAGAAEPEEGTPRSPALPLDDWLWVAPVGTLNGAPQSAAGYPRGLLLVHWGERVPELSLTVESAGRSERGEFGPASCALRFDESGDFRLTLARGDERVERTVTVNTDLGVP